jgi:NADH-quinone oxidoreductase subunit M
MSPLVYSAYLLDAAVFSPLIVGTLVLLFGRRLSLGTLSLAANLAAISALLQLVTLIVNGRLGGESPVGAFLLEPMGAALFGLTVVVGVAAVHRAIRQLPGVEKPHAYLGLILILWSGTLGAFASPLSTAEGAIKAYVYHEFALIPTFVLTVFWGGEGRRMASIQMAIYLTLGAMAGLVGLLIALNSTTPSSAATGLILLGFGTLASLFPFHSWAAPGYSAAPSPVSMIHAGALKKFGLLMIIQFAIGHLGAWSNLLLWLALGNTAFVSLICLAQRDLKQLVSWSSVAHMGPIFLGLWVADVTGKADGVHAAIFLMVAHGLSAAALFSLSNDVRTRTGTYRIEELGGLANRTPVLAAFFVAAAMASIGLPGFGNFWGEFGIFLSLREQSLWIQVAAASTIIVSAVYMLRAVAAVFYGPLNPELEKAPAALNDLTWSDRLIPLFLLGASLALGFNPSLLTRLLNP